MEQINCPKDCTFREECWNYPEVPEHLLTEQMFGLEAVGWTCRVYEIEKTFLRMGGKMEDYGCGPGCGTPECKKFLWKGKWPFVGE